MIRPARNVSRRKQAISSRFEASSAFPASIASELAQRHSARIFEALKTGLALRQITSSQREGNHTVTTLQTWPKKNSRSLDQRFREF